MDAAVKAWLYSQLGTATPLADLETRYTRLGTARAVALEVLGERLAAAIERPSSIGVPGAVTLSFSANITALERQIALLRDGVPPAPDDPDTDGATDPDALGFIRLVERPRR